MDVGAVAGGAALAIQGPGQADLRAIQLGDLERMAPDEARHGAPVMACETADEESVSVGVEGWHQPLGFTQGRLRLGLLGVVGLEDQGPLRGGL
jgi:hypothetical protein